MGYIVSPFDVSVDPSKVTTVRDWPTLTCLKGLQAFLGTVRYNWQYLKDFPMNARPELAHHEKYSLGMQCIGRAGIHQDERRTHHCSNVGLPEPKLSIPAYTDAVMWA